LANTFLFILQGSALTDYHLFAQDYIEIDASNDLVFGGRF